MSHRRAVLTGTCIGAVTAGLLIATAVTGPERAPGDRVPTSTAQRPPEAGPAPGPAPVGRDRDSRAGSSDSVPFGAFLGSGPEGVRRIDELRRWLGGREPTVGHTYLPGDRWENIEGRPRFLRPWAEWRKADEDRMFVLNVPMAEYNEAGLPDREVDRVLRVGAAGGYDRHFRTLAERLVRLGVPDTVVVLGWEMNGTTYGHRCGPNPEAWQEYWRRIVATMRSVPGQEFRFDFAPARGRDAVPWTRCYPGDRYVDIIGMDSYDQPPGETFREQVRQPYGLQAQVDFAEKHGKEISYPEWGLFREGDNPDYVRSMLDWIRENEPAYHTITDYCPHGVMRCDGNPESSRVFRSVMSEPGREPEPRPEPEPAPDLPWWQPRPFEFCVDLGDWLEELLDVEPPCFRFDGGLPR
ncbi:glycoside hydrolase family 26 protein [Streptomyces sp. TR06-5]|uniref:glycoside hydrolase family 26 protein n=1 Tax=Streptomyces sp. TR06-5 TaxID=3385976 RepID=UPI0039A3994A